MIALGVLAAVPMTLALLWFKRRRRLGSQTIARGAQMGYRRDASKDAIWPRFPR